MNKCHNCRHWTRDPDDCWELKCESSAEDELLTLGYGGCKAAKNGALAMPRYDGGYTGTLLTHRDFGCVLWEANESASGIAESITQRSRGG